MSKHKILCVEDKEIVLLVVSKQLEAEGYEVTTAASGEKAIKLLEKEPFDLVITDVVMEEVNGFEVVEKAKELCPETMIMILTGYKETDFVINALRLGVDDYLMKPVDKEDLLFSVQRCLEKGELQKKKKQAEEALKKSEEKFRTIVETAPSFLLIEDAKGNTIYASPNCEEIIGYTQEELLSKKIWWIHEEDILRAKELYDSTFQKGEGYRNFEYKAVKKKGEIRYFSSSWEPLRDKKGEITGGVLQTIDITERKKAQEALRESEERLRLVLQNMPAMMDAIDENGNIIVWNSECERIIGYSADEIIGNPKAWELIYPDADFRKFAKEERPKRGYDYSPREWDMVCKDGNVKTIEWYNISKLFPISGWSSWAIAIDVTKRKRAEEQVKASLKEKEILLQEIHHRVRNNMQVVSSLLKLQAGTMKDEKVRQAFKESQRRVSAMALVHETLYKSESVAEIELQKHIPALVDSIYRAFRIKQKVKLHVDIEDIKLSIDQATPLSLVINELISNSFKHAFPEGKGEIVVKVHLRGEDKIEVVIRDNGRGLPEDIDYEKSLGLQLVKGLVESQLEGTWDIKTEAGTKHTIRFKKKE